MLTESDLLDFWWAIKGPGCFPGPRLLAILIAPGGEVLPPLITVVDLPARADPVGVGALADRLREVVRTQVPGGSAAAMWARPGDDVLTEQDRAWCSALSNALAGRGLGRWPVHAANDHRVRVVAADDLVA